MKSKYVVKRSTKGYQTFRSNGCINEWEEDKGGRGTGWGGDQ